MYNYNPRPKVKIMKNKEKVELVGKTFDMVITLTMNYLHDKLELPADELMKHFEQAITWIEEFGEDRFSVDDVKQMLLEETGIDLNVMYRN